MAKSRSVKKAVPAVAVAEPPIDEQPAAAPPKKPSKRATKAVAKPKSARDPKPAAADVFAAAEAKPAKKATKSPSTKAKTLLRIPDVAGDAVHKAIPGYRKAKLQVKSGEAQVEANKAELEPIVVRLFAEAWVKQEGLPEKPVAVVNKDDEKLTHVTQDKSALATISEEVYAELVDLLPGAAEFIAEETRYAFNNDVLAEEGVRQALSAAIAAADLTDEQRGNLFSATRVYRTSESLVPKLLDLCDHDADKLAEALTILKGPITRYLNI